MVCTTLQLTNILSCLSLLRIFKMNDFLVLMVYKRLIPINFVFFVAWITFVWQGSSFEKLFSRKKIYFVAIFSILDFIITLIILFRFSCFNSQTFSKDYNTDHSDDGEYCTFDKFLIFCMNFFISFFIYMVYLYFGLCKKIFKENG